MEELLDKVKGFAKKAIGDDAHKYKKALDVGLEAIASARKLLTAVKDGDEATVKHVLTEWEDVNRTWEAVGKMDTAIEDAENGVELMEVLETIGKVVSIVAKIAALA